jgi:hypothetical protein
LCRTEFIPFLTQAERNKFRSTLMRIAPLNIALALVLGPAVLHGLWTERWQASPAMEVAAARLADVPLTIGDWQGEALALDPEAVAQAKLTGHWIRRYSHAATGRSLTVLLMCGPAGPVSVHTPEWCFGGAGYDMVGPAVQYTVHTEPPAEFWTARFSKPARVLPEQMRIFWAWSASGTWEAPRQPRLAYGRAPFLYKLYIIRNVTAPQQRLDDDPCLEFLRVFLPELSRTLFPVTN